MLEDTVGDDEEPVCVSEEPVEFVADHELVDAEDSDALEEELKLDVGGKYV
jgi:hypothetical protein